MGKIKRNFRNINSTMGLTDLEVDILLTYGNIENMSSEHVQGVNPDVDSATDEDVHFTGGDFAGFISAGAVVVKSSNALDVSKGVVICGLNADGEYTETAATTNAADGTTEVAVSGTWIALYNVYSTEATTLAGNLLVGPAGFGSTYLTTPAKCNNSMVGARQIPAGKIGFIKNVEGGLLGGVAASGAGVCLLCGSATQYWTRFAGLAVGYGSASKQGLWGPFVAGERVKLRAVNAIANNTVVNGSFDLILIDTETKGLDA